MSNVDDIQDKVKRLEKFWLAGMIILAVLWVFVIALCIVFNKSTKQTETEAPAANSAAVQETSYDLGWYEYVGGVITGEKKYVYGSQEIIKSIVVKLDNGQEIDVPIDDVITPYTVNQRVRVKVSYQFQVFDEN